MHWSSGVCLTVSYLHTQISMQADRVQGRSWSILLALWLHFWYFISSFPEYWESHTVPSNSFSRAAALLVPLDHSCVTHSLEREWIQAGLQEWRWHQEGRMLFSQLIVCLAHIIRTQKWQSSHQVTFLVCTQSNTMYFRLHWEIVHGLKRSSSVKLWFWPWRTPRLNLTKELFCRVHRAATGLQQAHGGLLPFLRDWDPHNDSELGLLCVF